jgi:hypothetical protein
MLGFEYNTAVGLRKPVAPPPVNDMPAGLRDALNVLWIQRDTALQGAPFLIYDHLMVMNDLMTMTN